MQDHKSVLDDALHSMTRKIVQSVAGSVAVMAAAGGILVVPEILSEKSVTAAIAKLSQPTQQIQSVIVMAADAGQRARSRMAVAEPMDEPTRKPVMMASAEPDSLTLPVEAAPPAPASSPFQPDPAPAAAAQTAPRVLPEASDRRFRVFDPMPDMPRVSVEEPKPAAVAKPAASEKPVEVAKPEVKKPVEVAKPAAAAKPVEAPQAAAVKPAEPVVVSLPMPPERPKLAARPVETPKAEPKAIIAEAPAAKPVRVEPPKEAMAAELAAASIAAPVAAPQEPIQLASVDPEISASTLALISTEAFGTPVLSEGPPDIAPDAKPPVAEEAIPTEVYKGPDALKLHAPAPAPEKPVDVAKPVEKLKVKTPADLLELNAKQRAKAERCLAEAVYFESRNEPVRGQIAVAQVVMNRVFSPYYPGEVCAVVYQNAHRHLSCQFTFACDGIPERVTERGPWARAQRIAKQTLDGKLWRPEVAKATHYHADYVKPKWIRDMRTLAKHGRHIFYRPHNWGDGREELGWVREHEMPMPRPRPVMVASARDAMAQAPAAAVTTQPGDAADSRSQSSKPATR